MEGPKLRSRFLRQKLEKLKDSQLLKSAFSVVSVRKIESKFKNIVFSLLFKTRLVGHDEGG